MIRIGPFRLGQGIALVFRSKQFVLGGGTKAFNKALVAELGVDTTRPRFPQWAYLTEDDDGLD